MVGNNVHRYHSEVGILGVERSGNIVKCVQLPGDDKRRHGGQTVDRVAEDVSDVDVG